MRTKEQLENLRGVFFGMVGPYAKFMSDEELNFHADNLQKKVDALTFQWKIKVRLTEQKDIPWSQINFEPNAPILTNNQISSTCKSLLAKYPGIEEIQVMDINPHSVILHFNREQQDGRAIEVLRS
jgi:hypothetical protein